MLSEVFASTFTNLVLFVVIPSMFYVGYQKYRHKRNYSEIRERLGLKAGDPRYLKYCALASLVVVGTILIWPQDVEALTREGSAWKNYSGLGFGTLSVQMALLYGIVQTGFAEEFLFRGMIAGSLSRRLSLVWANVIQALIFLVPHLLLLSIMPEMWVSLIFIFFGSLFAGWARIKSGSIVGPWMIHASANITMGLSIAMRTAA